MTFRDALYQHYALHPGHAREVREADFDRVQTARFGPWLPDDRAAPVLDLGCGDGALLGYLARRGHTALAGVDRAPVQVARARRAAPGAEVIEGRGDAVLAARPGAFAAILCVDVLEHLTRDELLDTLRLARAALRPGGVLIAQVPNAESPFHGAILHGDLTHERAYTPGSLAHALAVTGYDDFAARECGPVAKSLAGVVRVGAWRALRAAVVAWNLVETGAPGGGVYTRVMLCRARRPRGD